MLHLAVENESMKCHFTSIPSSSARMSATLVLTMASKFTGQSATFSEEMSIICLYQVFISEFVSTQPADVALSCLQIMELTQVKLDLKTLNNFT